MTVNCTCYCGRCASSRMGDSTRGRPPFQRAVVTLGRPRPDGRFPTRSEGLSKDPPSGFPVAPLGASLPGLNVPSAELPPLPMVGLTVPLADVGAPTHSVRVSGLVKRYGAVTT